MRFASVYQGWETLEDFEAAIQLLKIERENESELEQDAANSAPNHQISGDERVTAL
jgi:transcriptional repressor NrdR